LIVNVENNYFFLLKVLAVPVGLVEPAEAVEVAEDVAVAVNIFNFTSILLFIFKVVAVDIVKKKQWMQICISFQNVMIPSLPPSHFLKILFYICFPSFR
jgi:hypothetical protein